MKKIFLLIYFYISLIFSVLSQNIKGYVFEKNTKSTLIGVNLYWLNTTQGTTTDEKGFFSLQKNNISQKLVVSFLGFKNDTLLIEKDTTLQFFLENESILKEITIKDKKNIDTEPLKTELLTTKDLKKAACCNLSESFETNASVDVTITDAVTGGKQLKLLGLDGTYSQIMVENMPNIRGLASRSGLHLISGAAIKSIEINKGAGSVVNGYESMTGQINVELAKPENSEKLYLNGFINPFGRWELNANTALKINEKWSTAFLTHTSHLQNAIDQNMDGYMDTPKFSQYNFLNPWKYSGENTEAQFGFRYVNDQKVGGQSEHNHQTHQNQLLYGAGGKINLYEAWAKIGFISPRVENRSVGIILNARHHQQNSFFGKNNYDAFQNYLQGQVIYQTHIKQKHILRTGVSFVMDNYDEIWQQQIPENQEIIRKRYEKVVGAYAEFTWKPTEKFTLIQGIRTDYHNLFGAFLLPRTHLKYAFGDKTILRASAGRGFRVANPMIEQSGFLASSRKVIWNNNLLPEKAWNYGINLSQGFNLWGRKGQFSMDFYRTDFQNQIVTDVNNARQIEFYNLQGKSFANSFQVQMEYELIDDFNLTFAYKNYDVKTTFKETGLQNVPLIIRERFFANLEYSLRNSKTNEEITFDVTGEWLGSQFLPNTQNNPLEFQRRTTSPTYWLLNAQVTYKPKSQWEVYVGGEDLLNFMQENPIISANQPFGNYFDASIIYAPVMGRMIYGGFRFYLK